jgi:hypothetical protein
MSGQVLVSVEAGYGSYFGDDFSGQEPGFTGGGSLLLPAGQKVRVGVGLDYSTYGTGILDEGRTQVDINAIGRYALTEAGRFFVGGKLGFSHQSASILDVPSSSSGIGVGPVLGVNLPLASVHWTVSAEAIWQRFGDAKLSGETVPETGQDGLRWILRVGLGVPFGG